MKRLIAPIVLAISGLTLLCGLGFWQIERLEWKQGYLAEIEEKMAGAPVALDDLQAGEDQSAQNFKPIQVSGVFLDRYTDLLSGNADAGSGYRRIVAFDAGGRVILVEAGFVPETLKNTGFTWPEGQVEITGHVYQPEQNTGSIDVARNIWVGYNLEEMANMLDAEPVLIIAASSPIADWYDQPLSTASIPNNHLQYAITWFLLALVWLVMSAFWARSRMKKE